MAMQFIDGFDHYDNQLDKWDSETASNDAGSITQSRGRFTPGALALGATPPSIGGFLRKKLPDSTEAIVGFALFAISGGFFNVVLRNQSGGIVGSMTLSHPDIQLKNAAGTVVATASAVLTAATWQFLELRVKQSATIGELEVRVGSVTEASATNQNTGTNAINELEIDNAFQADDKFIDDLYILDTTGAAPQNTFIGDSRITVLRGKANGNNNQFTPTGSATNFGAINETLQDGDATFVEAGQIGAKEDYNQDDFVDLGISPGTIFAVQTVNTAKKTDAGQLKYKDQMVIGGVAFDNGTEVTATSVNYKMTTFVRDTDPSDDAAWTESKVAATGSGFEITFREV